MCGMQSEIYDEVVRCKHKHDVRDQVFPFHIPDSASAQVRSSKWVSNTRTRLHATSYEFENKLGQKYKLVECRERLPHLGANLELETLWYDRPAYRVMVAIGMVGTIVAESSRGRPL
ncbi:unnamed protein product [Microthlaspi erraticum]|uniref:Uncharacterized protein n=1 Tax=Microthlaspi erraticum TaxID=1685480 RepID=A0A6D2IKG9_9BRAS|nr:unnamed protein product [Microthlaspi erraticum]